MHASHGAGKFVLKYLPTTDGNNHIEAFCNINGCHFDVSGSSLWYEITCPTATSGYKLFYHFQNGTTFLPALPKMHIMAKNIYSIFYGT